MAYTNTWQIVSPVSSDDWTDMDNEVRSLKTDIVERVWEDGLHFQSSSLPTLSVSQAVLNASATTLRLKEGTEEYMSLVSGGKIDPSVQGYAVYGGLVDSSGLMRSVVCNKVSVTIASGPTGTGEVGAGGGRPGANVGYAASTVFWDDGSAFICKRLTGLGSGSEYDYSYVDTSSATHYVYIIRDLSSPSQTYSVYVMMKN